MGTAGELDPGVITAGWKVILQGGTSKKRRLEASNEVSLSQQPCWHLLEKHHNRDNQLGPNTRAEIYINGVPIQALVDTGSPATIAFLEFMLDIFFKGRKESQTPAQWREDTEKRLLGFALVADTGTKLAELLTGAECQTDLLELEEPHAEGSKTQMPSQQEQFA